MSARGTQIERDVVRVWGPDAVAFLQGQLSQDVEALAVGTSTWSFVLQPQGKVDAWARITRTAADEVLLDLDDGAGTALHDRLARFLIRTKAELEVLDQPCVAVRGAALPGGVEAMSLDELRAYGVEHGVPAMGRELTEATIPAEIGDWIVAESVSFTKGCFVGQELTARIDSRGGNVPRRLRALVCEAPVPEGDPVQADGPAAAVTTAAVSPRHGPIALAFLGRAVEPGAAVTVGDVPGVVHGLPLA